MSSHAHPPACGHERAGGAATTLLVIPSLGEPCLDRCLQAVASLEPAPGRVMVVLSGSSAVTAPSGTEVVRSPRPLGFAPAVNLALGARGYGAERIALLNDDALPEPRWLDRLGRALDADPGLAAVQGTVTDGAGERVDGRGIALDPVGLPVQRERGRATEQEAPEARQEVLAVSGTAALFRNAALHAVALPSRAILDPRFGSYHEDLDLGLRLARLGWRAAWVGGAPVRHLGSATGARQRWRHPWWLLANRWRALAGNLAPAALVTAMPRLLRGEARAVRTLLRSNPRTAPVAVAVLAALPVLVATGWARRTPGPRLSRLPESP